MRAVRVAFVIAGGIDPSGNQRIIPALVWLVERLARRHSVTVFVLRQLDRPLRYMFAGATVEDLGRPEGMRRQYAALVAAMRRNGRYDLLHAYWALPAGLAGVLAARRFGIPSVVTLDSGEFVAIPEVGYGLQQRARHRLAVAATCRLATHLTVCSRYQERLARASSASPTVMPFGVDTRLFVPAPRADGPPWQLVHVASLNRVKDQPMLVDAMRRLVERMPAVHLDVVGTDTLDGSIQQLVKQSGMTARVTFHGFQRSDALVSFYQRSHLAVLTSRHEAAGVVALEAAACGVATVGTDVGYLADWAPDAAVTVPVGDPAALANALSRTLDDRAERDRLAAAARNWTLAHDADWTAEQCDRLYHALTRADRSGLSHADKSRSSSA